MYDHPTDQVYCNLDTRGIRVRKGYGIAGTGMAVAVLLFYFDIFQVEPTTPRWAILVFFFISAFLAVVGFTQAQQKFCGFYGIAGLKEEGSELKKVSNDLQKRYFILGLRSFAYALVAAALLTGLIWVGDVMLG